MECKCFRVLHVLFDSLLKSKALRRSLRELMRLTACDHNRCVKSKQKPYRRVRRPARWAGCPAMLSFAGGRKTRFAQTVAALFPAKPALLGGYQAHPRQKHKTKVKSKIKLSGQAQPKIKTIRLCVPTHTEAPHTSHRSQPKAPNSPENLNKATETFSRDFSEGTPAGGFKRGFLGTFLSQDTKKYLASAWRSQAAKRF